MKGKDAKGKGKDTSGVCNECGTCRSFGWIFPIALLLLTLVPSWYGTSWAKWVIIVIAVLMIIKRVKPCKMCARA